MTNVFHKVLLEFRLLFLDVGYCSLIDIARNSTSLQVSQKLGL